ncbi:U4/U6.U5 tri-snRNP-associated protein [Chloropicon primus]|uniref:U4/U6.U5 tri-snRNP-associated protein n=1 Tax=Chloropicon primus TaxID=1764295 RepID=A0A5B8MH67_9CHLO|nr:U4/U6.U5 tri-snRNP-associated protein [Chloropicon primus]UPQ98633.1 U4/U6.U5 tri-snRNP-associated protein [Chloropicon primus]|eukprot:QDZ19424.1 U4/U6.U5 tri-snRNP-associated protein [Chloropicon primus]
MVDKTVELSVEETNALREKLGLKPLRVENKNKNKNKKRKRTRKNQEEEEAWPSKGSKGTEERDKVKDKLLAIREERLAKEKVDEGRVVRPLGEGGGGEEDDVRSWIKKSRKKEREEALRTQQALQDQEEFGDDDFAGQGSKRRRYASSELKGLKIGHDAQQFREGSQVILTLKDQGVLDDDGELQTGEDVLEDTLLAQQEKRDEAVRLSKPRNRYEEAAEKDLEGSGGVLCDGEDGSTRGMEIDGSGGVDVAKLKEQEEIRKKLKEGINYGKTKESADPIKRAMDDFWTQEEAATLEGAKDGSGKKRRRKKKKNIRMKKKDIDDLEARALASQTAGEANESEVNHGKRVEGMRSKHNKDSYLTEQARRDAAYSKAMSKAAEKTAEKFNQNMDVEEAQEDEENDAFFSALNRARETALSRQRRAGQGSEATMAMQVKSLSQREQVPGDLYGGEVFTETSEFCNTISARGMRNNNKKDGEKAGKERGEGDAKPESQGGASTSAGPEEEEKSKPREGGGKGVAVWDETAASTSNKGLGGALKLLQDRGELRKTVRWAGRTNDMKDNNVRDVIESYSDNGQFAQDIESALTRKDEFGRVMTPKEAFRQLCYKFHGIKQSKNKQEKKLKKYLEEQKQLEMGNKFA